MLEVFVPEISPRIAYVFDAIFKHILKVEYRIEIDVVAFEASSSLGKINYSDKTDVAGIQIAPTGLLNERIIAQQDIQVGEWKGTKTLFPNANAVVPFDLFSAVFYCISRYEEYTIAERDQHNRFESKNSILGQNDMLEAPVVDQWCMALKGILEEQFPQLVFGVRAYNFTTTVDVDNAYAYRAKGAWRALGSTARDLLKVDTKRLADRTKVWSGKRQDPYDTFSEMLNLHEKYDIAAIFFFLLADWGKFDKNISFRRKRLQQDIKKVAAQARVGIHLSYGATVTSEQIPKEIDRLASILPEKKIDANRQHYLRLNLPETYERLLENGIVEDHTMGYADRIGFRNGSCTPLPWYNLAKEEATKLTVHPFAAMDATLNRYMKLSVAQSVEQISRLNANVREVNGSFVLLWHNETLSERSFWVGWSSLYEVLLKLCKA